MASGLMPFVLRRIRRSPRLVGLEKWKGLTRTQAVLGQRKVTLQVLRGCIRGNPRKTGRSQNAWVATVGSPSAFALPAGEYGAPDVAAASSSLSGLQFGQTSWVVNNTEYVGFLENFHPSKAGWVRATIENVSAQFSTTSGSVGGAA
jgi:hypothetical protein